MCDILTRNILHFQRTGQGFPELLENTSLFVYRFLKNKKGMNEDDKSDFFCKFYPKIPVLFHRFVYRGKPFSVYLIVSLKWQLRSYLRQKRRNIYHRDIMEDQTLWHNPPYHDFVCEACEPTPEMTKEAKKIFEADKSGVVPNPVHRKRLLFLTMKGSMEIDYHITEHISLITGYEKNWLYNCILRLKLRMEQKRARLEMLRKKRNWYFTQIFIIHYKLLVEKNPVKRIGLYRILAENKTFMQNTLDEIAKVPIAPTHQEIADVLGIPKGSVDSGLYYLKNAFEKIYTSG